MINSAHNIALLAALAAHLVINTGLVVLSAKGLSKIGAMLYNALCLSVVFIRVPILSFLLSKNFPGCSSMSYCLSNLSFAGRIKCVLSLKSLERVEKQLRINQLARR